MYFLIDYENVNNTGLEGTEYLTKDDTVIIFYSDRNSNIVSYRMEEIKESGCAFELCKLANMGKNALDFYIATKVGEIFALNRDALVGIISNDKDYKAVQDYWKCRLANCYQLVRCKTIAKAMTIIHGEKKRKLYVTEKIKLLNLQEEFAKYEERNRITRIISKRFAGTEYEDLVGQIVEIIYSSEKPKEMYLAALKSFGRTGGIEVYRKIKEMKIGA